MEKNINLGMKTVQSPHASFIRGPRDQFLHNLSGGLNTEHNDLHKELVEWQMHIETQLLGGCNEYLTRWAQYLGIPDPATLPAHYTLLTELHDVARELPDQDSPTIDGLAKLLSAKRGHPLQDSNIGDARQSALAMIGCLTMLFNWCSPPAINQLKVEALRSQELTLKPQPSIPGAQRTIGKLLGSYGHLLMNTEHSENGVLHTSRLNYFTLRGIGRTKLKLVDHISSHLTFNQYTRELSVFAYPEYCAMRCSLVFQASALDRYAYPKETRRSRALSALTKHRLVADYYDQDSLDIIKLIHQEVLLSYWLIFGSTSRARAAMRHDYLSKPRLKWRGNKAFLSKLIGPTSRTMTIGSLANVFASHRQQPTGALPQEYWPQAVISDGQFTEQQTYSASEFGDFKIFGSRLLRLQEHCSQQNPTDVWDMWRDRRDRQSWITFWAVIIIGGASIIISFIQMILTAVQVWEQRPAILA